MPRRPFPATSTSTLHRAPVEDADPRQEAIPGTDEPDLSAPPDTGDHNSEPGELAAAAGGGVVPAGHEARVLAPAGVVQHRPAGGDGPWQDAAPADPDPAPTPRTRGRRSASRTAAAPAPAVIPALVSAPAPSGPVELTDEELADLGALTRMCLRFRVQIDAFVPELERMVAAYRRAQL